jgi:hypothetical protein
VTVGADLVRLAIDPQLNIVRERRRATFALLSADLATLVCPGRRHKDACQGLRAAARVKPHAGDPPAVAVISAAIQAARTGASEGND